MIIVVNKEHDNAPVRINVEQIAYYHAANDPLLRGTKVKVGSDVFLVKQSPEQIDKLISGKK